MLANNTINFKIEIRLKISSAFLFAPNNNFRSCDKEVTHIISPVSIGQLICTPQGRLFEQPC